MHLSSTSEVTMKILESCDIEMVSGGSINGLINGLITK